MARPGPAAAAARGSGAVCARSRMYAPAATGGSPRPPPAGAFPRCCRTAGMPGPPAVAPTAREASPAPACAAGEPNAVAPNVSDLGDRGHPRTTLEAWWNLLPRACRSCRPRTHQALTTPTSCSERGLRNIGTKIGTSPRGRRRGVDLRCWFGGASGNCEAPGGGPPPYCVSSSMRTEIAQGMHRLVLNRRSHVRPLLYGQRMQRPEPRGTTSTTTARCPALRT